LWCIVLSVGSPFQEKFNWSPQCQVAFDYIKSALVQPTLLQYPDFAKKNLYHKGASKQACGAVLS